jgi:hypothetical protein
MRKGWIWTVALLVSCGGPPATEGPAGEAVATWTGGALGLAELDEVLAGARTPACRALRRTPGGGSLEEIIPCYREVAEGLALERLVLSELEEELDGAIAGLDGYEQLRQQAFLGAYLRRVGEEIEISEAEIESHFEANRELYRRPGTLRLWNIFRRHEEGGRPEETVEILRRVKARFEAGETFDSLAREVSQSETRVRGGLVGDLQRGALPAILEKIAFALADGEVSEPIRVKGGAVLLHVRNVVEETPFTLQQAAGQIRSELRSSRVRQRIVEDASGLEAPPGSTVLSLEQLLAALDGGDPDLVALQISGTPLTVAQIRQMAGLAPADAAADLTEEQRRQLAELYQNQRDRQLLTADLVESAGPELRQEAEERLRQGGVSRLVDERLRQEMQSMVEADPESLKGYWEDNRHHYQSPLRFKLWLWNQPFGDEPPQQLWRMEQLRESLAAGKLDLEAAAARLGGSVEDLGWMEYDSLGSELSQTALAQLLEVGETGFTAPYHQQGELHLIWLEQRNEPRPLEYGETRERVREDYLARFQQQLYRRALERRLAAVEFLFDEEAVRRLLAPPGTEAPAIDP